MAETETSRTAATRRTGFDRTMFAAGYVVYVFLALPVLVIILSAFSPQAFPEFPPTHFSTRWFSAVLTNPDWLSALSTSSILLLIVTPLTVVLGSTAAYALARLEFRGRALVQAALLSPLMIPQVVLGIALLYVFITLDVGGSLTGLIVGHTVVALPYVVRSVSVSMAAFDPRLEAASMSLGAGPVRTFCKVTLPLIRPGVVAGAVFAAVTSFGEVSVSAFVAAPTTVTVPIRIFNYIDQTFDPSVNAVSVVFIVVAVLALIIIERTVGLTKVM